MARRTLEDMRVATIIAERSGMLGQVESHRAAMALAVRAGRISENEAALVNRQIAAFAEGCAIGLHVDGNTPAAVRDALRLLVKAVSYG